MSSPARRIRGIDAKPWGRARLAAWILVAASVAGCSSTPTAVYKLYPGPERSAGELAFLRSEGVPRLRVDGLWLDPEDWAGAQLAAGAHRIEWQDAPGKAHLLGDDAAVFEGTIGAEIVLLAGHRYAVRVLPGDAGWPSKQVRVEDEESGEVLAQWEGP